MQVDLIVKDAKQVVSSIGASFQPKVKNDLGRLEVIENGCIAIADDRIVQVGQTDAVLSAVDLSAGTKVIDARGKIVLPGLVDAHTHTIFAGSREHELEMKQQGLSYLDILSRGGGILSTVQATRAATKEELTIICSKYLDQMLAQGTTTAEIKSGYGLTIKDELKVLQAVKELNDNHPMDIVSTFLGAHAIPLEYKDQPWEYVNLVINNMIPQVREAGLAEFCDVFCESGVFSIEQSRKILLAAKQVGFKLKIHADEIVSLGGAELAASLGAVSADHLLAISDEGIRQMAAKQVMAVVLPTTTFFLREAHYAPARRIIEAGIPLALATDFNPGSSPCNSLQVVMNIAALYLNMTPAEIINCITINAAHAIGRAERIGSLEVGKQADLVIFDAQNYEYLPYRFGTNLVEQVIKNGRVVK